MRLISKIALGFGLIVALGTAQAQWGPGGGGHGGGGQGGGGHGGGGHGGGGHGGGGHGGGGHGGGGHGGGGHGGGGHGGGGQRYYWQCFQDAWRVASPYKRFYASVQARFQGEAVSLATPLLYQQELFNLYAPSSPVRCFPQRR